MQFMMQPSMVYEYPLWGVGLLLAGAAALGAIVLGLAVRPLLSLELRRQHNDVAAAIFSVIGVTFAVLLAFVAMVVWEHYNAAKATSYAEAGFVRDVYYASLGSPTRTSRCCATASLAMSRPWSESNGRRKPGGRAFRAIQPG